MDLISRLPPAHNEPVLTYAPATPERIALKTALQAQLDQVADIPMVIDGSEYRCTRPQALHAPHDRRFTLAHVHQADAAHAQLAVQAANRAQTDWSQLPFDARAAVFLKAAELLSGPWRQRMNAATMLGQGKNAHQAEIDAACELIDFLRFNVSFARQILEQQPESGSGCWNRLEYRPLEGFVDAVTPFNFTAIGGNLAAAPALMGNCVIWKPAHTASLSNYLFMELLQEAGLPPGVINFLPGHPEVVSRGLLGETTFAGLHFTGSTAVFNQLWQQAAQNLPSYRSYPRLVGETGGKDFVLAHASADVQAVAVALVRGAFEYQGQKCSAASRAYIPRTLWRRLKPALVDLMGSLTMGSPLEFAHFMGPVIDARAFARIRQYIDAASHEGSAQIVVGGGTDDREGYFIEPTLVEVADPQFVTMREEIFGPVLSVYVYEDAAWPEVLRLVDGTSAYALTGAVFAQDRRVIEQAQAALRFCAGNLYFNDKPTGAVVGQQPFGGSRTSGTNDKAGSPLNLLRWTSPRTIKETFAPARSVYYPFMAAG